MNKLYKMNRSSIRKLLIEVRITCASINQKHFINNLVIQYSQLRYFIYNFRSDIVSPVRISKKMKEGIESNVSTKRELFRVVNEAVNF